jgi:hypothetical protein
MPNMDVGYTPTGHPSNRRQRPKLGHTRTRHPFMPNRPADAALALLRGGRRATDLGANRNYDHDQGGTRWSRPF